MKKETIDHPMTYLSLCAFPCIFAKGALKTHKNFTENYTERISKLEWKKMS
jgi:hypothetical protein